MARQWRRSNLGVDYLPGDNPLAAETTKDAPLVFVGLGVVAPAFKRDDYAGLDVRNKIVVVLAGTPATLPTEAPAHYGNGINKRRVAVEHGAIGMITDYTPIREKVSPFARSVRNWRSLGATRAHQDGTPKVPGGSASNLATLGVAGAAKLFAWLANGADAVFAAAKGQDTNPKRMALRSGRALRSRPR